MQVGSTTRMFPTASLKSARNSLAAGLKVLYSRYETLFRVACVGCTRLCFDICTAVH